MLAASTPEDGPGEPLSPEAIKQLRDFIAARLDRFREPFQRFTCERDGHRPAARWRGAELRCFRCQRCGEETQP